MGKIPASLRSSAIPVTQLLKNPPQSQPSKSLPPSYFSPNAKKPRSFRPPIKPSLNPNSSPLLVSQFTSPNLSDAKTLINSLISDPKSPIDLQFHNSLLQSFSSISTLDDAFSLFSHMLKTLPSFSPDRTSFHILITRSCNPKTNESSVVDYVFRAVDFMAAHGLTPDSVTADIAVRGLCFSGRDEDAVKFVTELHWSLAAHWSDNGDLL